MGLFSAAAAEGILSSPLLSAFRQFTVTLLFNKPARRRPTRAAVIPHRFLLLHIFLLFLVLMGRQHFPHSLLVAAAANSAEQQCPQWVSEEIQLCVQPVAEFARTLNQQQTERENAKEHQDQQGQKSFGSEFGSALQWPTKMGGQVFRELCRLINDFEICVNGYRHKCRRHITINLIEASYGFLCNEGFETFMASAECLMELDQQPSVKGCHDRTLREIEQANGDQNGTVAAKLDRMCNALNFFAECVRPPIRSNCGQNAWRVIFRVLKDTSRTLMPMCHFDEYADDEAATALVNDEEERHLIKQESSSNSPSPIQQQEVQQTQKSLEYGSEEFSGRNPFGRGKSRGGTSNQNNAGGKGDWERWEEPEDEEEDDDEEGEQSASNEDGIGIHIEMEDPSSQQQQVHPQGQLRSNGAAQQRIGGEYSRMILPAISFTILILALFYNY